MNITEYGDFMPFGPPAILDEWGRRKIDGLVEDGVGIVSRIKIPGWHSIKREATTGWKSINREAGTGWKGILTE